MTETQKLSLCIEALERIAFVRDYHSRNGEYPPGYLGSDQCFDDWAADIATQTMATVGYDYDEFV